MTTTEPLTNKLQNAINHERLKLKQKEIARAELLLAEAKEYSIQLDAKYDMMMEYDEAYLSGIIWTAITSKEKIERQIRQLQEKYQRCMNLYYEILRNEVTNK